MPLTKNNIAESICRRPDLPKNKPIQLVESLLEIMKKALANGEDVLISGFGKFCVRDKKERRGRNPETGDDMMLKPRRAVTFRYSGVLRNKMNGKG